MSLSATEKHASSNNLQKKLDENMFRHSRAPFGYRMVNGKYVVVPEQAGIVNEIFDMVLAGNGTMLVARELNRRNIPTGTVKRDGALGDWSASMVQGILSNEFYTGDVLKYKDQLVTDYAENPDDARLAPFLIRNHHEALVDRETFCLANAVNRQLGLEKGCVRGKTNPNRGQSALTGKLRCGKCGASMKRVRQSTADGVIFHWSCTRHLRDREACSMKRIKEDTVKNSFITLVNKLCFLNCGNTQDSVIPGLHPLEDFDEGLFENAVLSADVMTDEKIVFHLSGGLKLTERIVPERMN